MTFTTRAPLIDDALLGRLALRADVSHGAATLDVTAPFSQELIGSVPAADGSDVKRAAERARDAQASWADTPLKARLSVFRRFHDLLADRADQAMDLIQLEAGKARIPAFEEVFDTIATTRYYTNVAPKLLKTRRRAVSFPGLTSAFELRHPVGVVVNITPWNFPFTLAISDVVAALIAGNAVIAKPDEHTPYSALYGALLFDEAGLPPGVFQVLPGYGEELGPELIDQADFVGFTGSTPVGKTIASQAGQRLIPASMELGGKNAAVVLADADLDVVIPGISRAVFANGGQLCIAMERIYVDNQIRDQFTERLVAHTNDLELSPAFDFSSDLSAMIDAEHLDRVHGHVEEAVELGASLLTGGKPRPDIGSTFYEPTILTNVDETMELCRGETFGPVVSLYGFDDIDQAVDAANDSDLGLNFSVWTRDEQRGFEIASQLHAGTVGVNDGYAAAWSSYDAPMGGMKSSGLSRRHGSAGLLKYTESQTVAIQRWLPAFAPPPGLAYETYKALLAPALKILRRLPFYK